MARTIPKAIKFYPMRIIGYTKSLFGLAPVFGGGEVKEYERVYHADRFTPELRPIPPKEVTE